MSLRSIKTRVSFYCVTCGLYLGDDLVDVVNHANQEPLHRIIPMVDYECLECGFKTDNVQDVIRHECGARKK